MTMYVVIAEFHFTQGVRQKYLNRGILLLGTLNYSAAAFHPCSHEEECIFKAMLASDNFHGEATWNLKITTERRWDCGWWYTFYSLLLWPCWRWRWQTEKEKETWWRYGCGKTHSLFCLGWGVGDRERFRNYKSTIIFWIWKRQHPPSSPTLFLSLTPYHQWWYPEWV